MNRRNNRANNRGRAANRPARRRAVVAVVPVKKANNNQSKRAPQQVTTVGKVLRSVGGTVGGLLGYPSLGRAAGGAISRVFGQGDYSVNAPNSNSLMGQGPPTFGPLTSGFRIKHREFITDIQSSTDFAETSYQINPGQALMFPWLSSIAAHFEEYEIHGCVVYLNSTSGTAIGSTNTAMGLWGAVTQYDPAAPAFTSKQQCENYVGCQTATPSQSLLHGIECKPRSNVLQRMYVRSQGQDIANEDLKFYDWGKLQVFTKGMQLGGVTIGEMFVSYDISFYKPKLPDSVLKASVDMYYPAAAAAIQPLGGITTGPISGSNVGTQVVGTALQFTSTVAAGLYMVYVRWAGTGTAATCAPPTVALQNGLAGVNLLDNFTTNTLKTLATPVAATNGCDVLYSVRVPIRSTGVVPTMNFNTNGVFPGNCNVNIIVYAVPESLVPTVTDTHSKLKMSEVSMLRQLLADFNDKQKAELLRELREPEEEYKQNLDVRDIARESVEYL